MNEQAINDIKNALREVMQLLVQRGEPINDEVKTLLAQVMEHAATRIQELRQKPTSGVEAPTPGLEATRPTSETGKATQPTGKPVPELEGTPFPSSNINAFRYEPQSQTLYVKFQDKYPGTNGPVYSYGGVPKYIFNIFSQGSVAPKTSGKNRWHTWKQGVTPSHGAAMAALIKAGGFPYERLS